MSSAQNGEGSVEVDAAALRAQFTLRAEAVGAEVLIANQCDLAAAVERATQRLAAGGVRVSNQLSDRFPELDGQAREARGWPAVAVSLAHFALAATGSVALAEPWEDRRFSLLCYRHIVLAPSVPLPTLYEASSILRTWSASGSRRYVTFVTGPSRTSDIERVLTIGVHGPAELVVVLVDGWEPPHA
jgi:L-lactate dehydrogenase complex protein LldG